MTEQDHDVPAAYLMYSVFRASERIPGEVDRAGLARDVEAALEDIEGLTVRGWYDVSGFRADADLMVWWWAPRAEALQDAYHRLLASALGEYLTPVWSQVGPNPGATCACTRSCAAMTGICCPSRSGRRCCVITGWPRGDSKMSSPTPLPRSGSAITNGYWASRPTGLTASWTSCVPCGTPRLAGTCAKRSRSTRGRGLR